MFLILLSDSVLTFGASGTQVRVDIDLHRLQCFLSLVMHFCQASVIRWRYSINVFAFPMTAVIWPLPKLIKFEAPLCRHSEALVLCLTTNETALVFSSRAMLQNIGEFTLMFPGPTCTRKFDSVAKDVISCPLRFYICWP